MHTRPENPSSVSLTTYDDKHTAVLWLKLNLTHPNSGAVGRAFVTRDTGTNRISIMSDGHLTITLDIGEMGLDLTEPISIDIQPFMAGGDFEINLDGPWPESNINSVSKNNNELPEDSFYVVANRFTIKRQENHERAVYVLSARNSPTPSPTLSPVPSPVPTNTVGPTPSPASSFSPTPSDTPTRNREPVVRSVSVSPSKVSRSARVSVRVEFSVHQPEKVQVIFKSKSHNRSVNLKYSAESWKAMLKGGAFRRRAAYKLVVRYLNEAQWKNYNSTKLITSR